MYGSADGLNWHYVGTAEKYIVEFSAEGFDNALIFETETQRIDFFAVPDGNHQWRVFAGDKWFAGNDFTVKDSVSEPKELISNSDGNMDVFFANASGTWDDYYAAQHLGFNGWSGTKEFASLAGKNNITDVFVGSEDANVLVLTDDANGDALFVEDIYSALGDQARFSQIDEIRAGAGDDITHRP